MRARSPSVPASPRRACSCRRSQPRVSAGRRRRRGPGAELAVFRLAELGFDPVSVLSASGRAPVAPVAGDEATAMARTTDALAYGSEVHLTVDESFDRFDEVPSVAAEEYGEPLEGVFEGVDWDFAELPVELFGPAAVTIDVVGGDTHVVGEASEGVLAESFGL
nr:methenyltetrahydromethanopterin cyclohydrolase [Haloarcula sp. CBA1122]